MSRNFNTNTDNNDTWLTPPELIKSLGEFDLDPCSPINRPWNTAADHYTIDDDGLLMPWHGRVWCNPPYGKELGRWLEKMALHQNCIGLTFARTETKAFQYYVFPHAYSIHFIRGRIQFYRIDGSKMDSANAPSVLISYNELNSEAIEESGIKGHHIYLKNGLFIIGISYNEDKTWKLIIQDVLIDLKNDSTLDEIYEAVEKKVPARVRKNKNYKAKVRQILQLNFERVERGVYRN